MKPGRPVAIAGGLGLALWPSGAEAHLVTTGLGPVYDGLLHFALTPEDLVPALALALLAGLRGATHGRRALFVLPAAWLGGGVLGLATHGSVSPVLTAISFVVVGAWWRRTPGCRCTRRARWPHCSASFTAT